MAFASSERRASINNHKNHLHHKEKGAGIDKNNRKISDDSDDGVPMVTNSSSDPLEVERFTYYNNNALSPDDKRVVVVVNANSNSKILNSSSSTTSLKKEKQAQSLGPKLSLSKSSQSNDSVDNLITIDELGDTNTNHLDSTSENKHQDSAIINIGRNSGRQKRALQSKGVQGKLVDNQLVNVVNDQYDGLITLTNSTQKQPTTKPNNPINNNEHHRNPAKLGKLAIGKNRQKIEQQQKQESGVEDENQGQTGESGDTTSSLHNNKSANFSSDSSLKRRPNTILNQMNNKAAPNNSNNNDDDNGDDSTTELRHSDIQPGNKLTAKAGNYRLSIPYNNNNNNNNNGNNINNSTRDHKPQITNDSAASSLTSQAKGSDVDPNGQPDGHNGRGTRMRLLLLAPKSNVNHPEASKTSDITSDNKLDTNWQLAESVPPAAAAPNPLSSPLVMISHKEEPEATGHSSYTSLSSWSWSSLYNQHSRQEIVPLFALLSLLFIIGVYFIWRKCCFCSGKRKSLSSRRDRILPGFNDNHHSNGKLHNHQQFNKKNPNLLVFGNHSNGNEFFSDTVVCKQARSDQRLVLTNSNIRLDFSSKDNKNCAGFLESNFAESDGSWALEKKSGSTGCLAPSRFENPTWASNLQKSSSFNASKNHQQTSNENIANNNPLITNNNNNNNNNMKSLMKFRQKHKQLNSGSSNPPLEGQLGRLRFKIEYDFNKSILYVELIEASQLAAMDLCGSSDPYVKIFLLPDKRQYEKTRVHKKTLNPKFNETFQFQIGYSELMNRTLLMMVYDHDRFSRHDTIGQVSIPIESLDLSQTCEQWRNLKPVNDSNGSPLGDLCLSLRYVPTAGKLNVVVLEARRLKKMDVAGLSDPYVKISLMCNGKRIKKKKTSIKKCTLNPHYNESFSFEIPFEKIQQVQLVFMVVDYDRLGHSDPIGKIVLGCDSTSGDTERRHWMDMLGSPRRPIAQWHTLKEPDHSDILMGVAKQQSATMNKE